MSQISNFSKSIAENSDNISEAMLPRAAEVVEVKGRAVRIRYADEFVAGQTWYPCAVGWAVAVGTVGVVHRLRDRAGYFEPIASPVAATEFRVFNNSSLVGTTLVAASGTDTANMVNVFSGTLQELAPVCNEGTWKVMVTLSVTATRNVNSGGIAVYAGIGSGGAGAIPRGLTVINTPISGTISYRHDAVLPDTLIRGMFSGQGVAGTTTRSAANMSLTAVRTG